jgi:hypothetical protein
MQIDPSELTVDLLIVDASAVAVRLDRLRSYEDRTAIRNEAIYGWREYAALQERRSLADLTPQDSTTLQILLDTVLARLKFLDRWSQASSSVLPNCDDAASLKR